MSGEKMPQLATLMARLRAPEGCPWDREQNHDTLKTHLTEEAYEVIEAIEAQDPALLKEELGDLLLQIVFHAQIGEEEGQFTLDDVIQGIYEKLIRRHPHVFADVDLKTSRDVIKNWEALKASEMDDNGHSKNAHRQSILDGTPRNLPPMVQAYQLTSRASRVGFDWEKAVDIFEKLEEEARELRDSLLQDNRQRISEEIGDLLFVVVNLARHLHVDPELALRRTNEKFITRFRYVEEQLQQQGRELREATLEEMDHYWKESKSK